MNLPSRVKDLIPQKGKMGFDAMLIKADGINGEGSALIGPDNIFLNDRMELSPVVLIEYVNQLVASILGYHAKNSGKETSKGLFVGVQDAGFFKTVCAGDLLKMKGTLTEEVAQVSFIEGIIERNGEIAAGLTTKLYEVRDKKEFERMMNEATAGEKFKGPISMVNKTPDFILSPMHRKLFSYIYNMETGNSIISFGISCPGDFDAFDGHFPGNPILPGIILLEIGTLALEILLQKPVSVSLIKKMKIGNVVLPDQHLSCSVTVDKSDLSNISFSAVLMGIDNREISRYSGRCSPGK